LRAPTGLGVVRTTLIGGGVYFSRGGEGVGGAVGGGFGIDLGSFITVTT